MVTISFFISPHGFGHAARAAAVIEEIDLLVQDCKFELFTTVPEWFFQTSLSDSVRFNYHSLKTDVGFVQPTPVTEDLQLTVESLQSLYPLPELLITELSEKLLFLNTNIVVCDIAVMGLVAANQARIPAVLIENFTWDWMYESFVKLEPRFSKFIDYLGPLFESATLRLQANPICRLRNHAKSIAPIARKARSSAKKTREGLGVDSESKLVLVSMGGISGGIDYLHELQKWTSLQFLVAGIPNVQSTPDNIIGIPAQSEFYHPDLVAASDALIGKVGYSTVCEAYYGRTQFFFMKRPHFRESALTEDFVSKKLAGLAIGETDLGQTTWNFEVLNQLIEIDPLEHGTENGALGAAREIVKLMSGLP